MGIVDLMHIEKYIFVESTFQRVLLIRGIWMYFEPSNSLLHFLIKWKLYSLFVLSNIKGRLKQVFRRPSAI
ncbi:hypothetical protein, partial [Neisseria sp. P0014.S004]|uniref:hypothetical protein n=1 Tax=Neisseria sp. P0014.S004 TaxID=3436750 RepID=UPI003F7D9C64